MEELKKRLPAVNIAFYVDMKTIENVHQVLGIPLGSGAGVEAEDVEEEEEEESVDEDD